MKTNKIKLKIFTPFLLHLNLEKIKKINEIRPSLYKCYYSAQSVLKKFTQSLEVQYSENRGVLTNVLKFESYKLCIIKINNFTTLHFYYTFTTLVVKCKLYFYYTTPPIPYRGVVSVVKRNILSLLQCNEVLK